MLDLEEAKGLKALWSAVLQNYLTLLFPSLFDLLGHDVDEEQGFSFCPEQILVCIITFIGTVLTSRIPVDRVPSQKDFALCVLRSLILSNEENRELVHEVIRQCMLTSHEKLGSCIIDFWINDDGPERPAYLIQNIGSNPNILDQTESSGATFAEANLMIRRYLRYIHASTLDKNGDEEDQVALLI